MNLGQRGEDLIKSFETLRLQAYRDQRGITTIGWGHTRGVLLTDTCTIDQAEIWFLSDVAVSVAGCNRTLLVPLNQNQFDALVSFTFNLGVGSEAHSTLLKDINSEDFAGAADQFLQWDHVDGVVDPGLTRRRFAERALFLTPV
jgi:lysozyme